MWPCHDDEAKSIQWWHGRNRWLQLKGVTSLCIGVFFYFLEGFSWHLWQHKRSYADTFILKYLSAIYSSFYVVVYNVSLFPLLHWFSGHTENRSSLWAPCSTIVIVFLLPHHWLRLLTVFGYWGKGKILQLTLSFRFADSWSHCMFCCLPTVQGMGILPERPVWTGPWHQRLWPLKRWTCLDAPSKLQISLSL